MRRVSYAFVGLLALGLGIAGGRLSLGLGASDAAAGQTSAASERNVGVNDLVDSTQVESQDQSAVQAHPVLTSPTGHSSVDVDSSLLEDLEIARPFAREKPDVATVNEQAPLTLGEALSGR